jgi:hypothetical protein
MIVQFSQFTLKDLVPAHHVIRLRKWHPLRISTTEIGGFGDFRYESRCVISERRLMSPQGAWGDAEHLDGAENPNGGNERWRDLVSSWRSALPRF